MRFIRRDGAALAYEEAEGRRVPLLFVHGWCCDHEFFAPQFDHFAKAGHRVVAVDLRGHGASDKPRERYTMQGFADDVAFVCKAISLANAIVVGHSMGGMIAFDFASRHPEFTTALVMVDGAIVLPRASRAVAPGMLRELSGPNPAGVVRDFVGKTLFLPSDDAGRREFDPLQNGLGPPACRGFGLSGHARL